MSLGGAREGGGALFGSCWPNSTLSDYLLDRLDYPSTSVDCLGTRPVDPAQTRSRPPKEPCRHAERFLVDW